MNGILYPVIIDRIFAGAPRRSHSFSLKLTWPAWNLVSFGIVSRSRIFCRLAPGVVVISALWVFQWAAVIGFVVMKPFGFFFWGDSFRGCVFEWRQSCRFAKFSREYFGDSVLLFDKLCQFRLCKTISARRGNGVKQLTYCLVWWFVQGSPLFYYFSSPSTCIMQ